MVFFKAPEENRHYMAMFTAKEDKGGGVALMACYEAPVPSPPLVITPRMSWRFHPTGGGRVTK